MKENKIPDIEIKIDLEEMAKPAQVVENKEEKTAIGGLTQTTTIKEMPTITSLLNRKKLSVHKENPVPNQENSAPKVVVGPSDASVSVSKDLSENSALQTAHSASYGVPPEFSQNIWLPQVHVFQLSKNLSTHQKSKSLKRRDVLGCLSRYFSEVAYFQAQSSSQFQGVLGYGNALLISTVKNTKLDLGRITSIKKWFFGKSKIVVQAIDRLSENEKEVLHAIGFDFGLSQLCVFCVYKRRFLFFKKCIGIWICMRDPKIKYPNDSELNELQKILNNTEL